MIVKDIQPREIAVLCEFTVEQIEAILFSLDNCVITYDNSNKKDDKKVKYVIEHFHKTLVALKERIDNVT
jgi:hypothetical protein